MKEKDEIKKKLLRETSKCRACRFCVDVCPTYQALEGVETLTSFGRMQTLRYLLLGTLELDDAMIHTLYSCLQCGRCEVVCKSKGQNLEIANIIHEGRTLLCPVE